MVAGGHGNDVRQPDETTQHGRETGWRVTPPSPGSRGRSGATSSERRATGVTRRSGRRVRRAPTLRLQHDSVDCAQESKVGRPGPPSRPARVSRRTTLSDVGRAAKVMGSMPGTCRNAAPRPCGRGADPAPGARRAHPRRRTGREISATATRMGWQVAPLAHQGTRDQSGLEVLLDDVLGHRPEEGPRGTSNAPRGVSRAAGRLDQRQIPASAVTSTGAACSRARPSRPAQGIRAAGIQMGIAGISIS